MGKSNSLHIGIYGRRNVGKSTLINAITGQEVAIVSPVAGTTTDPVKRSFELLGVGSVVFIDTAGIDDKDELGTKRVQKTLNSLRQIDLAILVLTSPQVNIQLHEQQLLDEFSRLGIPHILVYNTHNGYIIPQTLQAEPYSAVELNAKTGEGVEKLLAQLAELASKKEKKPSLLGDVVHSGDIVLLITPIDSEAPEGRLILPQVNTIRDILDNEAVALVMKENEVAHFLNHSGIKPNLVIADSQLFKQADMLIPHSIPLTSFSIILARQKGNFEAYLASAPAISTLKDNDRVLLLESCSHQTSCEDIGRVKIPNWLKKFTGKQLEFEMVGGHNEMKRPVSDYALVIQCGGCMVTRRQLANNLQPFIDAGIPVTNYGMAIAYTQGIFDRATELFRKSKA